MIVFIEMKILYSFCFQVGYDYFYYFVLIFVCDYVVWYVDCLKW